MTPASVAVDRARVRYLGRSQPALDGLTISIGQGEQLGITGRTDAGKSTLALLTAGFIPRVIRARVEGSVVVDGVEATADERRELAGRVGIVFSTPAHQLSASKPTVREELAFGLENLGVPRAEMDGLIDTVLGDLAITHLGDREPLSLSGGEQQRVAIASIVVMGTRVIVLDEPTAQLDPSGAASVAGLMGRLAADGRTIVCVEQQTDILAGMDRCLVLDQGQQVALGSPARALGRASLDPVGLAPPTIVTLAEVAGTSDDHAFDERAVANALQETGHRLAPPESRPPIDPVEPLRAHRDASIEASGLVHRYDPRIVALRGVTLAIGPGQSVAIIGQNGSGKTTLAKHFNGLLRPTDGTVRVGGRDASGVPISTLAGVVGFVFQDPDDQLFERTTEREVAFGPRRLRLEDRVADALIDRALQLTGLSDARASNPYDLGASRRKLVALASVLASDPAVLILDEPTAGQDGPGIERIGSIVDGWRAGGRSVVAITHDMGFAATHFDRVVVMHGGAIVLDAPPTEVFAARNAETLASIGLRPPVIARIAARLRLEEAPRTIGDLLGALRERSAARPGA